MTIIAHIVESFVMEIEEPEEGHDEWFLDWVLRSPKNAGRHLTAGWRGLQSLNATGAQIETVNEYFGGMGAQALMVDRLFPLKNHWVGEYSKEAVAHLKRVLPYGHTRCDVDAFWRDAYDRTEPTPVMDLQILDFGDLTAWKTREDEPHRKLLDAVFATEPKAVLLTDIACRYLHLHRERYETMLGAGTCGSYTSYLEAFQRRLQALYGYVPVTTHWDRWSAVMLLMPQDYELLPQTTWQMIPTPGDPVGLEIL